MQTDSKFVKHIECDSCGSSDGNAMYDDGHTHCFVCNKTIFVENMETKQNVINIAKGSNKKFILSDIADRKIKLETCRRY